MVEVIIPGKAKVGYDGKGILEIRMLPKSTIDLKAAIAIVDHALEITQKAVHCNLVDIRDMSYISNEAQKHFADQNNTHVPAVAILMNSAVQKNLTNIYFRFSNPMIPTRAFDNEDKAMEWLQSKLEESTNLF